MNPLYRLALLAAAAAVAAGCSGFGSKSNEYKSAAQRAAQPLEIPPELTAPTADERFAIPDPKAQTSYSAYSQRTAPGAAAASAAAPASGVLPRIDGVKLERFGDQRWLVVKGEPEAVWPVMREFWIAAGFTLVREEPQTGIMETDWHDDITKIPDDFVRRTLGRYMPNAFSTPRRDKFRTRLEKGAVPGTTEVFVSNRNVEEVFADAGKDRTVWEGRPADREAEAEMLQRMVVRLGNAPVQVASAPASAGSTGAAAGTQANNAVLSGGGLTVNDSFDRAWRRVGLALDRVGFTVEDRDRSKGLFFVRYIDPERDLDTGKKEGFMDKLKFWKPSPKSAQPQYRIHVADAGASMSQVQVQDSKGAPETSSTGKRILSLLFDQLK
jgi:outer membrane protein assembly factor BamC